MTYRLKKKSIRKKSRGGDGEGGGLLHPPEICPWIKAQFSFSLSRNLHCRKSFSGSKIRGEERKASKRVSVTHDCERDK